MSKVKYFIKNNSNPTTIYVRFSVTREILFRKTTQLQIDSKLFNNKTGKLKNIESFEGKDELNATLENLRGYIITAFNTSNSRKELIDSNWFGVVIDKFFNRHKENDLGFLEKYANHYVEKLPTKANPDGSIGVTQNTIVKYTTILRKINAYENYKNKRYRLTDVGISFRDDFLRFLLEEHKLSQNTAGRYIKFVKTICLDAKRNGFEVSKQLDAVKGFSVKTDKVVLSFEEIQKIENTSFDCSRLESARDWLILGCFLGQRVSDLLMLTKDNIVAKGNLRLVELTQKKTKKKVSVLLHPRVEAILNKYDGEFPPKFSVQYEYNKIVFNRLIKEVTEKSGIIEKIYGGKINSKTRRKEWGTYEKWRLVSSHICRRSFATNFYGDIPTPLLISCTGHSTEKEFLKYIGKASIDYAEQLAKYWNS